MTSSKFTAGTVFPDLIWPALGGGEIAPGQGTGWRLLVVYRGKHCPRCRSYLKTLQDMLGDFAEAGIAVYAISADPVERASAEAQDEGWTFPLGYDLAPPQMRQPGLYLSDPRSPEETDRPFSEPGIFVINDAGRVQIIDVSNSPIARPDMRQLLGGLKFVMEKGYPIRGTA